MQNGYDRWVDKHTGVVVGRPIKGCTLNPLEYLLDDDGKLHLFGNKKGAVDFLKEHGFTDDAIEGFTFFKYKCGELISISKDEE